METISYNNLTITQKIAYKALWGRMFNLSSGVQTGVILGPGINAHPSWITAVKEITLSV